MGKHPEEFCENHHDGSAPCGLYGPITTAQIRAKVRPVDPGSLATVDQGAWPPPSKLSVPAEAFHETLRRRGQALTELLVKKNKAYGNSFRSAGQALALLYPDGIRPEQYADALAMARIWDKLGRVATDPDAFGEDPFDDLAGYAMLAGARREVDGVADYARRTADEAGPTS